MDDKEELLEAIDNYSLFTKVQKKVLRCLVEIEIGSKAVIDVLTLSKLAKTSPAAIYKTIKLFENDNILQVIPSANKKINTFFLKLNRINEIKEVALRINKLK